MAKKVRPSIVFTPNKCSVEGCLCDYNLEPHEIFFGTANRQKSIDDKMVAYLCRKHHTGTSEAVHENRKLDMVLKIKGQTIWEQTYGNRDAFIKRYGRNYL